MSAQRTRRWAPVLVTIPLVLAAAAVPASAQLVLRLVVSGLTEPLALVQDPTEASVQFIVQKGGRIRVLKNGVLQSADFLNLTGIVSTESERGLLGLAFAPDYASSRRFYVNFTNLQGHTVIARFKRSASNPLAADTSTRFDLRWPNGQRYITQPFANHNGGTLRFGPDGYLYVGMGDGGSSNDPDHRAQNKATLLGKMLRIDVSVADADVRGYRVPANNPFVDGVPVLGALGEIWAFGLRNPWKFSFDEPVRGGTGGLFIGDVGQSSREEIDFEPAGAGGRNYGWRNREGTLAGAATPVLAPAYTPLTNPIHDYSRTIGQCVTGGWVYRGARLPVAYVGRYFFGDFIAGRVRSLRLAYGATGEASVADIIDHTEELGGAAATGLISSIDIDAAGELYLVDFRGSIRRIERGISLTLNVSGSGSISAGPPAGQCTGSCSWSVALGSLMTLTPTAAAGWAFAGWGGDSDCLDARLTMTVTRTCSARFVARLPASAGTPKLDFNNDGRADVFTYRSDVGTWSMEMSGTTGFGGSLQGAWAAGWTIRPGDFNGDGLTDLFLYNRTTGQWFKATRTATGDFTYFTATWRAGWDVHVLDLTGDGRSDVFLYDPPSGLWFKCLTIGSGEFSYFSGTWEVGWQVYPAELDGNKQADLFLYNASTGRWGRAVNDGAAGWALLTGLWRDRWTVHIGDFNGDGRSDVFLYDTISGQWFVCTNTNGDFTYVTSVWASHWTVRIGDVNADGRADVFLYNRTTGQWFQAVTIPGGFSYFTGTWAAAWDVHLADFNGDRRADVLLYRPSSGAWMRCINNGLGVFLRETGAWAQGLTVIATPALPQ